MTPSKIDLDKVDPRIKFAREPTPEEIAEETANYEEWLKGQNMATGPDDWKMPGVKAAFDDLVDTFGGAEPGRFYNLLLLVRYLDEKAGEGDEAARPLLELILRMSRLIDAAQKCGARA